MTAIARLTCAELRKLATTSAYAIALAIGVALSVISVVVDAGRRQERHRPAGQHSQHRPMLKLGVVGCVAMLVLGIVAASSDTGTGPSSRPRLSPPPRRPGGRQDGRHRHRRRGSGGPDLRLGPGHHRPGAVRPRPAPPAGRHRPVVRLLGDRRHLVRRDRRGARLPHRSTIAAVVCAVGWVLFAELAILHTLAPQLAKWLITGAATALTDPTLHGSGTLPPATAIAVLSGYAAVLLAAATPFVIRRDIA